MNDEAAEVGAYGRAVREVADLRSRLAEQAQTHAKAVRNLRAAEAAVTRARALASEWELLREYVSDPKSTPEQRARSEAGVIAAEQLRVALDGE